MSVTERGVLAQSESLTDFSIRFAANCLLAVMGNVDDPRDLKTVEKDLSKSSDQKEAAYTEINKLNNEQKSLNEQISRITNQAATAERTAREKEDAFNRDQESTKRKDELNEELQRLLDQDKELEKQVRMRMYNPACMIFQQTDICCSSIL